MASDALSPTDRTFRSADLSLGDVIELGFGGEARVWAVGISSLHNATLRGTETVPARLLFESAGTIVVRVSAHNPPGPAPRVNTTFHVLRYTTLDGIVTIKAGGFSFPLTL